MPPIAPQRPLPSTVLLHPLARPQTAHRSRAAWLQRLAPLGMLGVASWMAGCASPVGVVPQQAAEPSGVIRTYLPPEHQLGEFATVYSCGGRELVVGRVGFLVRATLGPEQVDLVPDRTTAGERYVADGPSGTQLSIQGDGVQLTWAGQLLPACRRLQHLPSALQAKGFQPEWTLDADAHGVRIHWAVRGKQAASTEAVPLSKARPLALGLPLQMGDAVVASSVTVTHALCVDGQTDLPRPYRVEVRRDGSTHVGCGGSLLAMLQAKTWWLVDGGGLPRIQLRFGTDGRLWGEAGCNRYQAGYKLEGAFLRVQPVATTRKACLGNAMQAEQAYLKWLPTVSRYALAENGELTLLTSDGQAHRLR